MGVGGPDGHAALPPVPGGGGYRPPVWPEKPGEQQKSVHLDFAVGDLAAAVALAEGLGARKAPVQYDPGWTVMFDPAGHPFCLNQL